MSPPPWELNGGDRKKEKNLKPKVSNYSIENFEGKNKFLIYEKKKVKKRNLEEEFRVSKEF